MRDFLLYNRLIGTDPVSDADTSITPQPPTPNPQATTPNPQSAIDPERQRLAREYAGLRHWLFALDLGLGVALLAGLLGTGASAAIRSWAEGLVPGDWWWAVVVLYVAVLGLAYTVIVLPLNFYSEYVLPHRYGQSSSSLGLWLADLGKETALEAVFGVPFAVVLVGLLRAFPDWWWAIMAVLVLGVSIVLAQLAPVLLLPLFFKVRPLADGTLRDRLMSMAAQAGSPVRGVYTMDLSRRTQAANAMFTGLGPTKRIILGDTMLADYSTDEIETVLAHELAHQVHGDLWRGIAFQAVLTLAGLWVASVGLRWGVTWFGFRGIADVAALPLVAAALGGFFLVLLPASNAFTRRMERAADDYALRLTAKPRAFQAVMAKLAGQNLSEATPAPWVVFLFYSHPPIAERIAHAERYATGDG
jgi:STE24 endopeptidase